MCVFFKLRLNILKCILKNVNKENARAYNGMKYVLQKNDITTMPCLLDLCEIYLYLKDLLILELKPNIFCAWTVYKGWTYLL